MGVTTHGSTFYYPKEQFLASKMLAVNMKYRIHVPCARMCAIDRCSKFSFIELVLATIELLNQKLHRLQSGLVE